MDQHMYPYPSKITVGTPRLVPVTVCCSSRTDAVSSATGWMTAHQDECQNGNGAKRGGGGPFIQLRLISRRRDKSRDDTLSPERDPRRV
ncbi:Hypothetical protein SMAX5B_015352 [Scophthalmus maximus]|uniref:Uncharacterized protein n=1 Tax=Scophthalmus maximus TaxID=52904 RepID=A0A2U9C8W4_SCOMX|nr:Hypothetical protein SMAX5B_015352 [Scophthalmus maximus]